MLVAVERPSLPYLSDGQPRTFRRAPEWPHSYSVRNADAWPRGSLSWWPHPKSSFAFSCSDRTSSVWVPANRRPRCDDDRFRWLADRWLCGRRSPAGVWRFPSRFLCWLVHRSDVAWLVGVALNRKLHAAIERWAPERRRGIQRTPAGHGRVEGEWASRQLFRPSRGRQLGRAYLWSSDWGRRRQPRLPNRRQCLYGLRVKYRCIKLFKLNIFCFELI